MKKLILIALCVQGFFGWHKNISAGFWDFFGTTERELLEEQGNRIKNIKAEFIGLTSFAKKMVLYEQVFKILAQQCGENPDRFTFRLMTKDEEINTLKECADFRIINEGERIEMNAPLSGFSFSGDKVVITLSIYMEHFCPEEIVLGALYNCVDTLNEMKVDTKGYDQMLNDKKNLCKNGNEDTWGKIFSGKFNQEKLYSPAEITELGNLVNECFGNTGKK